MFGTHKLVVLLKRNKNRIALQLQELEIQNCMKTTRSCRIKSYREDEIWKKIKVQQVQEKNVNNAMEQWSWFLIHATDALMISASRSLRTSYFSKISE